MPLRASGWDIRAQVRAVVFLAAAALSFAALTFTAQTGEVGIFFNNVLRLLAGEAALLVPVLLISCLLLNALQTKVANVRQRLLGTVLIFCLALVFAQMQGMTGQLDPIREHGFPRASLRFGYEQQGGGLIGALFSVILFVLFRDVGSYIVLAALALIAFLLVTNYSLTRLFAGIWIVLAAAGRAAGRMFKALFAWITVSSAAGDDDEEDGEDEAINTGKTTATAEPQPEAGPAVPDPLPFTLPVQQLPSVQETAPAACKRPLGTEAFKSYSNCGIPAAARRADYLLPPLSLLSRLPRAKDNQQQKSVAERAKILERTLESFGVKAKVADVQTGPTVTRFEVQPEAGVKVSKIVALADDLALNLAAPDVRIEAPIPGKAAVGIEVPNKAVAPVYLREVLEDELFQKADSFLTVALGKDITGNPVLADLMKMPHLLIAGSTGSGKSVCLNALIASILFKATPKEVKFVMIDPKIVELSIFNGIPHLLLPVVTEPRKAAQALKNMVKEMARRYELFARETVRDIRSYNEKIRQLTTAQEQLPYIVVIIDELADLMIVAAADVEDSIARLAQMSRAAGIHLVIATQRPSVDVITGVIKANITSRVAFAVSSQADSRTILDIGGADRLLGRGDMLFHPLGAPKPFRVQGAFINERELHALLEFIKEQGESVPCEQFLPGEDVEEEWQDEDGLFPEAVMLVAEAGTASISLLQRRLRIGYTRAARLIDDMERRGFVGRFEGSKAREVMLTADQAQQLLFSGREQ
ncbi:MAG: DNA translocase SpoIIIE [Syntrophomonadaceae bacterium]|nr:DNA translocase SpoIIIE [Bacillota bacterium]